MNVKIGLIGSTGRMGTAIRALAAQDLSFWIEASFHSGRLPDPTAPVDLFLDVSLPSALSHNLRVAIVSKKPLVVGTTGHANLDMLKEASQYIPIFYSPNFSLGMALMRRAAAEFGRKFSPAARIDLIEAHHAEKRDAPSGSAKTLAEVIREVHPAPVQIRSIRSGDLAGEHTLHFETDEERLTLIHQVHNRDAFARGALAAAKFLTKQPPGFYGMDDLLHLISEKKTACPLS